MSLTSYFPLQLLTPGLLITCCSHSGKDDAGAARYLQTRIREHFEHLYTLMLSIRTPEIQYLRRAKFVQRVSVEF